MEKINRKKWDIKKIKTFVENGDPILSKIYAESTDGKHSEGVQLNLVDDDPVYIGFRNIELFIQVWVSCPFDPESVGGNGVPVKLALKGSKAQVMSYCFAVGYTEKDMKDLGYSPQAISNYRTRTKNKYKDTLEELDIEVKEKIDRSSSKKKANTASINVSRPSKK